jgi:hexosaminidase
VTISYARQRADELRRRFPEHVPAVVITDHPDFAVRGYMLDISRDRVPTMESLEWLVAVLARCRINHLELYTEHTFAYRDHELVWRDASPMTPDELRQLDGWCHDHGIELVANQNCFGHFERWLRHDAYRHRARRDGARRCSAPIYRPRRSRRPTTTPRSRSIWCARWRSASAARR